MLAFCVRFIFFSDHFGITSQYKTRTFIVARKDGQELEILAAFAGALVTDQFGIDLHGVSIKIYYLEIFMSQTSAACHLFRLS